MQGTPADDGLARINEKLRRLSREKPDRRLLLDIAALKQDARGGLRLQGKAEDKARAKAFKDALVALDELEFRAQRVLDDAKAESLNLPSFQAVLKEMERMKDAFAELEEELADELRAVQREVKRTPRVRATPGCGCSGSSRIEARRRAGVPASRDFIENSACGAARAELKGERRSRRPLSARRRPDSGPRPPPPLASGGPPPRRGRA